MADLRQLRADIVASVLAKCLEAITNCYIKLEVNGLLTLTIDSSTNMEIPVTAVCHKAFNDIPAEQSSPEADSTNKMDIIGQNAEIAKLPNAITMSDLDLGRKNKGRKNKYAPSSRDSYGNDDSEQQSRGLTTEHSQLNASLLSKEHCNRHSNQDHASRITSQPMFEQAIMHMNAFSSKQMTKTKNQPQPEMGPFSFHESTKKLPNSRKKRPSVKRKQYSSEALINAYRKVVEDNASISSAAKLFGVPRTTLNDKLQGHVPIVHGNYKMARTEETPPNKESIYTADTELSDCQDLPLRNIKIENDHFEETDAVNDEKEEEVKT